MKKIILFLALMALAKAAPVTALEHYGRLRAEGNRIVGRDGNPVSLAGNSFFWSQWQGQWWNAACVQWLAKDWGSTIVRAAMGVEHDGYLDAPDREQARVEKIVDAATAAGIYVIIDWHDHRAHQHEEAAIRFFQKMARKYAHQSNVVYEIYNEPVKVSWKDQVKPYSERVIAAIRAIDPDNLILVGSPHWSQDVDIAAADPIQAKNIAYTLHFYAATHKAELRAKAEAALKAGVALFVSEWGTCEASGNGKIDVESTAEWMAFMRQHHLTHCNWAVSDKPEAASVLLPGAATTGGWQDAQLTPSGLLARRWIRDWDKLVTTADARN